MFTYDTETILVFESTHYMFTQSQYELKIHFSGVSVGRKVQICIYEHICTHGVLLVSLFYRVIATFISLSFPLGICASLSLCLLPTWANQGRQWEDFNRETMLFPVEVCMKTFLTWNICSHPQSLIEDRSCRRLLDCVWEHLLMQVIVSFSVYFLLPIL